MTTTLQTEVTNLTEGHFAGLYQIMQHNQDAHNASKILDLFEKYRKNQFNICFAGHFSAGKSSIINDVLGKEVLPKSPIPTSANIVHISSGEGYARVFFKDESPVQYNEPYDIDIIKDYCMDKDTIKQINISTKEKILPANCVIMDTPGIDAADDADRLMTESAIHVVDVLFYVMDYNHVQSEVNLYFLQEMREKNLPIYIIINQVDKHNDAEISFEAYTNKVKQTFDQWSISPEAIYYTTVMQPENVHNQLADIKDLLFHMMEYAHQEKSQLSHAFYSVVDDHHKYIREHLEEATNEISMDIAVKKEMELLKTKIQKVKKKKTNLQKEFLEEVQSTLKNAYMMPAKLRDLAGEFLKSQEKGFKIGVFQSKKKTNEAKEERLIAFFDALTNSIETTVQWKLREKTVELLQAYEITSESLLQYVQQFSISFKKEDLYTFLKTGAMVNGNYILNYTNDLSNSIKNKYRQAANGLWERIAKAADFKWQNEKQKLEEALKPFEEQQQQLFEKEKMEEEINEKNAAIQDQLEAPVVTDEDINRIEDALLLRQKIKIEQAPNKIMPSLVNKDEKKSISSIPIKGNYYKDTIIGALDQVMNEITNLEGFSSIIRDLKDKQARLSNRILTIALFGTFSAGKSSFSNALFGEKVLPVSPNPTTAVISRISPISKVNPHGKVVISLKSEVELIGDLKSITKHLETNAETFAEWMSWIRQERIYEHPYLAKTYQSYLEALMAGFDQQHASLGGFVEISIDDFASFVTDETKACYIQAVDLYYDCALTRKGITLVDTPGADSVNARHTNVAFDYIKEADAILYVTYYNHAITSGDRDFLMQLGRVKDSFEMDKMFFIVNASDLAESKQDLELVVKYVTGQLLHFGIRHPKIFPVSSKLSLEEKKSGIALNNDMVQFEESFFNFIEKDLIALTVESSILDMERATNTLSQFIQSLRMNEADRKQKITQLREQNETCQQMIQALDTQVFQQRMVDRIERQLHFVMDRLYIRFHDLFGEHFNSSTINASGKKAVSQLEYNRNQFVDYVGYELLQEVRAVSLRIEAYMKELMNEAYEIMQKETKSLNDLFVVTNMEDVVFDTPLYVQAFEKLDLVIFQKALKIFKNTKSFFEQNDRKKMENAFYNIIQPLAQEYIDKEKLTMETAYKEQWQQHIQQMKDKVMQDIYSLSEDHITLLSTTVDVQELEQRYERLKKVVANQREEQ